MLELRVNKNFQKTNGYRLFRGWLKTVRDIIEQGQQEGSVRNDMDPVVIQELLLGTLEHYVTRWLLKDESWDLLEFREQTIELIMNGIKPAGGDEAKRLPTRRGRPRSQTCIRDEPASLLIPSPHGVPLEDAARESRPSCRLPAHR
jgi:hypothetical protein